MVRGNKRRWVEKQLNSRIQKKIRLKAALDRIKFCGAARAFLESNGFEPPVDTKEMLKAANKLGFVYIPPGLSKPILFGTYSHNCVALRKISDTPKPYYKQLGYEPVQLLSKQLIQKNSQMRDFQYVVLHRSVIADDWKWTDQEVFKLLENIAWIKGNNKGRVTYFLDDCIIHADHKHWKEVVDMCDAMVVPNKVMEEYVRRYGFEGPVEICDTHVDISHIDTLEPNNDVWKEGKTRLLFASVGLVGLGFIDDIFKVVNEKFPDKCQVFVSGLQAGIARIRFNRFRNIDFIYNMHLPEDEYMSMFKSADLILNPVDASTLSLIGIPEEDREIFLDGKSPVKWCNAGVVRKPIINGVSAPYKRVVRHGENSLMTDKTEDWVQVIDDAINHPERFDEMVRISRDEVEVNFDTKQRAIEYIKAFTGNEVSYGEEKTA